MSGGFDALSGGSLDGNAAHSLYARLERGRQLYCEPVNLAGVALDVGAGDGRYGEAIRALGANTVYVVEPDAYEIGEGVASGLIDPSRAYVCDMEEWADFGHDPADVAYVLNVSRRLVTDAGFIGSVAAAVRPNGLVVTSFTENEHGQHFLATTAANPQFGLRLLLTSPAKVAAAAMPIGPPRNSSPANRYLCLWRKNKDENSGVASDAEAATMGALAEGDRDDAGRGARHLRIGRVSLTYGRGRDG